VRQHHGVEEESIVGFEDDLEALRAELDSREAKRNVGKPVGNPGRLTAKVVDDARMVEDSVYMSPGGENVD
jgi:hypothetical protein